MARRLMIIVEVEAKHDSYVYWSDPDWVRERLEDLLTKVVVTDLIIKDVGEIEERE